MAASQESGTMDVRLHPLVVMAICDHLTLEKEQKSKNSASGLLFGKQEGRVVSVFEAFDLPKIDRESLEQFERCDLENFKSIYPDYEFVGWYTTGSSLSPKDSEVHERLTKDVEAKEADWRSERPLLILLDPTKSDHRELPIQIYEQIFVVSGQAKKAEFVRSNFKVVSDEGERVTVVHCANVITGDEGKEQSALVTPYTSLKNAIQALHERITFLMKFLGDVQEGKIKADQQILRKIKALCHRLPTMNAPSFKDDFFLEYNDSVLVAYMAAITQSQSLISEVVEKHNIIAQPQIKSRGLDRPMAFF